MRWFRSHRGFGSRLALFALGVQLVLSFGHVHLNKLLSFSPALAGVSASSLSTPSDRSDQSADRDCPICALIQLAATSAPSAPPALAVPAAFAHVVLQAPDEFAPAASPHSSFQARAPPSA